MSIPVWRTALQVQRAFVTVRSSSEMFSQDSEKAVFHLKVKNSRTYSLMRLIPDILVKFQKSAWLARRWLQLDDMKTKDLNERLQKLAVLEEQFSKRVSTLSRNILCRSTAYLCNLFLSYIVSKFLCFETFIAFFASSISLTSVCSSVQDRCEELERALEQEKKEKHTLQAALYPISKDKEFISERLRDKQMRIAMEDPRPDKTKWGGYLTAVKGWWRIERLDMFPFTSCC
jgi:hypothetical protein